MRKQTGLDIVASFPWPIGLTFGVVAFWAIRYGIPAYLLHLSDPILRGLGKGMTSGPLVMLAWLVMLGCWMAAGVSYLRAKQRQRLLDTRTSLDSLALLSWREFEMLVGEAYRRQGFLVEETGLTGGGADGGVDLVLRRGKTKELVQCKQWRSRQVNASRVREMWGLVDHFDADGVKIVCIGEFTRDAMQFARGKRIELVTGPQLLKLVQAAQRTLHDFPSAVTAETPQLPITTAVQLVPSPPTCPTCGDPMLHRHNRATGQGFWGCGKYPICKGTREMKGLA